MKGNLNLSALDLNKDFKRKKIIELIFFFHKEFLYLLYSGEVSNTNSILKVT